MLELNFSDYLRPTKRSVIQTSPESERASAPRSVGVTKDLIGRQKPSYWPTGTTH